MNTAKQIVAPIAVLLVTSIAFASVFAYYPLTITVSPQEPGVRFGAGSNVGQPDIGTGNTISTTIGQSGTSVSITIHPTYQENYYKNVTVITNSDDNAMNVYLIFDSVLINQNVTVKLFVYEGTTKVTVLDIASQSIGTPIRVGQIASGETWQIDLYVNIPEGTSITGAQYQVTARLVYTPSSETPPANPSSGR
uniref:DUF1102 domain-containing protein n=2 Tax=Ignisphaera aggregans TaxID=334771 RepID=A0A7J3JRG9_9CREN